MGWIRMWRSGHAHGAAQEAEGRAGEGQGRTPHVAPVQSAPCVAEALQRRGVPADLARLLSDRFAASLAGLNGDEQHARLDGAALALTLQKDVMGELSRSLQGLEEVERMMGAFSGELSKLDEVLEVLAAYVARMRTSGNGGGDERTLH